MNKKGRIDGLKRACNIIEAERLIAIEINPVMALGMLHVARLIKEEIETLEVSGND